MVQHGPVAHTLLRLDEQQREARPALDEPDRCPAIVAAHRRHLLQVLHLGLRGAHAPAEDEVGNVSAAIQLREPRGPQEFGDTPLQPDGLPPDAEMAEVDEVFLAVVIEEGGPAALQLIERGHVDGREEASQHLMGELLHARLVASGEAAKNLQRGTGEVAFARLSAALGTPDIPCQREALDGKGQRGALRELHELHPGVALARGEDDEVRDLQDARHGNEVLEAIHP
mmetsp:Transcript_102260/g.305314  ORF Transcript_102260/g.305314 Transcript_102260/m.305314 type:complete len:228 (+) Transcript_102260:499-1182(+)